MPHHVVLLGPHPRRWSLSTAGGDRPSLTHAPAHEHAFLDAQGRERFPKPSFTSMSQALRFFGQSPVGLNWPHHPRELQRQRTATVFDTVPQGPGAAVLGMGSGEWSPAAPAPDREQVSPLVWHQACCRFSILFSSTYFCIRHRHFYVFITGPL